MQPFQEKKRKWRNLEQQSWTDPKNWFWYQSKKATACWRTRKSQTDDSCRRRPKFPLSKIKNPRSQKVHFGFAPFSANTLEIQGNNGFFYRPNFYIEKYNTILLCPSSKIVYFYDATTLSPLEDRKALQVNAPVIHISFCEVIVVCLFACIYGQIYAYDLSNRPLTKLQKMAKHLFQQ